MLPFAPITTTPCSVRGGDAVVEVGMPCVVLVVLDAVVLVVVDDVGLVVVDAGEVTVVVVESPGAAAAFEANAIGTTKAPIASTDAPEVRSRRQFTWVRGGVRVLGAAGFTAPYRPVYTGYEETRIARPRTRGDGAGTSHQGGLTPSLG